MTAQGEKALAGKVALVTGGGRGIGAGICARLAADGAFVIMNYLSDRSSAEDVVARIEAAGGDAVAIQGDIGAIASIQAFYRETDAYLSSRRGSDRIDILVNNACVLWSHGLDVTEDDYDRIMAVNLKGPFFMALEVASRMPDGGRIINISSNAARCALAVMPLYSIAKHGLTGVTRNLALALGPRNICVNGLEPGITITDATMANMEAVRACAAGTPQDLGSDGVDAERQPLAPRLPDGGHDVDPDLAAMVKSSVAMGRMGEPSDIADVVAFFASDEAHWVTGQSFGVDGGLKL